MPQDEVVSQDEIVFDELEGAENQEKHDNLAGDEFEEDSDEFEDSCSNPTDAQPKARHELQLQLGHNI